MDAFPPTEKGEVVEESKPEARELLLGDPKRLVRAPRTLGSLSDFMKHLRTGTHSVHLNTYLTGQELRVRRWRHIDLPLRAARRVRFSRCPLSTAHWHTRSMHDSANFAADGVSPASTTACPVSDRAGLAERIEGCRETSIAERLQENSEEALAAYLAPLASGLDAGAAEHGAQAAPAETRSDETPASDRVPAVEAPATPNRPPPYPSISQRDYIGMVRGMAEATVAPASRRPDRVAALLARMAVLGKRSVPTGRGDAWPAGSGGAAFNSARRRCRPDAAVLRGLPPNAARPAVRPVVVGGALDRWPRHGAASAVDSASAVRAGLPGRPFDFRPCLAVRPRRDLRMPAS